MTEEQKEEKEQKEMVKIYIMNKPYDVPKDLTIIQALEYAGYTLEKECGCRGGFCGSCGGVWQKQNDYRIYVGLACQTVVEDGMYLGQIGFFLAPKPVYDIEKLKPTAGTIAQIHPEVYRCVGCNSCTKVCPQGIDTMEVMQAAIKGDIEKAAKLSFTCLMCGLCASKCPAWIVQYNIGLLCRRLYGAKLAPKSEQLEKRIKEIEDGRFDSEIEELKNMSESELREKYRKRDIKQ